MATEEQYKAALIKAHNAGDTQAANLFAGKIKQLRSATPEEGGILEAVGEPALAMAGGIAGQVASGLEGLGRLAASGVTDLLGGEGESLDEINREMRATQEALSYTPKTQAGQAGLENIAAAAGALEDLGTSAVAGTAGLANVALNPLSNIQQGFAPAAGVVRDIQDTGVAKTLGQGTLGVTGSPLAATAAEISPDIIGSLIGLRAVKNPALKATETAKSIIPDTPTKRLLKQKLEAGSTDVDTARYMLNGAGKVSKDKAAVEAIRQGVDESVTAALKGSTDLDKKVMSRMVDTLDKGLKNARFAAENRPTDVIGDNLVKRVKFIRAKNKEAGVQVDKAARSLAGKDIDPTQSVDSLFNDLADAGVNVDDAGKLTFDGSDFEGIKQAEDVISRVYNRAKKLPANDAYSMHRLKKYIDENVDFGKAGEGLSGRAERIVKKFRATIDNQLDISFPEYNKANEAFRETRSALDNMQDAVGRKLDFSSSSASKQTGTVLRRLLSNVQSRGALLDSIDSINTTAKNFGGRFDDDIITQVMFADELEKLFRPSARTSLQGEVSKAVDRAAMGQAGVVAEGVERVGGALERMRGINNENRIKALKELLNAKTK